MSTFTAPWALCGGWAVDAWLGRETREHGDADVAVFIQDQRALFDHLAGWQLVAHRPNASGNTNDPWDGRRLDLPTHIHGRLDAGEAPPDGVLTPQQGFWLDVQFADRSGADWILSHEPRISFPLQDGVQQSTWGLPTVVPDVLLFFKALELRRRDRVDFSALLPLLSEGQRDWLREALARVGHPWLPQLATIR